MQSKRTPPSNVALGGMLAALAMVVMGMGTLIPVATYACPMLCILLLEVVRRLCGGSLGWAWYGAVAILSVLLAPDKEAAVIFCALGYYPMVKPRLDQRKGSWIWKALLFNGTILILYWLMMHLLGFGQIAAEFEELGVWMTALTLVLGNVVFFLLDRLLERKPKRKR